MDETVLKTQKEIEDFLTGEMKVDNMNSKLSMNEIRGWEKRPFHVYHGADIKDGDKIISGMIHIASQVGLPIKDGVVIPVKPFTDKFVYNIKVAEITEIMLEPIKK